MADRMADTLSGELIDLLGEEGFVSFVEAFGGTRLYVPSRIVADHEIAAAVGMVRAQALSRRFAPAVIRVPLARELRARHYRAAGKSNAQIARKLGISETSVDKLFRRMPDKPVKNSR